VDAAKTHGELGELAPKDIFFRAHNLLTSGDGTLALKWGSTGAYREDADGKPVYHQTILDRIFDTHLERDIGAGPSPPESTSHGVETSRTVVSEFMIPDLLT
jgi:hypothetical protein